MTSKRSTQSVTQRSTRQSELHKARRPRRLVAPKTVDDAVGLSRKEERELKRALYASLHELRRPRTPQLEEESSTSEEIPKLRKSTRHVVSPLSYPAGPKDRSQESSTNMDESSQDSVLSEVSTREFKKKIHAQRKFAQGCSAPSTPGASPGKKVVTSPHSLLNRVPKTEDFLTFLCLRGSRLLPPNLDYFNVARDESSMDEGSSRPRTPVSGEQNGQTRESTPESSSSGSNVNDELIEITTPLSMPLRLLQASRKAARASAGTPETARGIVSLRQGLTRKVVHSARTTTANTPPRHHQSNRRYLCTPEKTPSPSGSGMGARLMFGDFTPAKKSASVKCLPASLLRFSPVGKLALERNGNSLCLTPHKSSSPATLIPRKGRGSNSHGQGTPQLPTQGRTKRRFRRESASAKRKDSIYSINSCNSGSGHTDTESGNMVSASEDTGRKNSVAGKTSQVLSENVQIDRKRKHITSADNEAVFKKPAVPKSFGADSARRLTQQCVPGSMANKYLSVCLTKLPPYISADRIKRLKVVKKASDPNAGYICIIEGEESDWPSKSSEYEPSSAEVFQNSAATAKVPSLFCNNGHLSQPAFTKAQSARSSEGSSATEDLESSQSFEDHESSESCDDQDSSQSCEDQDSSQSCEDLESSQSCEELECVDGNLLKPVADKVVHRESKVLVKDSRLCILKLDAVKPLSQADTGLFLKQKSSEQKADVSLARKKSKTDTPVCKKNRYIEKNIDSWRVILQETETIVSMAKSVKKAMKKTASQQCNRKIRLLYKKISMYSSRLNELAHREKKNEEKFIKMRMSFDKLMQNFSRMDAMSVHCAKAPQSTCALCEETWWDCGSVKCGVKTKSCLVQEDWRPKINGELNMDRGNGCHQRFIICDIGDMTFAFSRLSVVSTDVRQPAESWARSKLSDMQSTDQKLGFLSSDQNKTLVLAKAERRISGMSELSELADSDSETSERKGLPLTSSSDVSDDASSLCSEEQDAESVVMSEICDPNSDDDMRCHIDTDMDLGLDLRKVSTSFVNDTDNYYGDDFTIYQPDADAVKQSDNGTDDNIDTTCLLHESGDLHEDLEAGPDLYSKNDSQNSEQLDLKGWDRQSGEQTVTSSGLMDIAENFHSQNANTACKQTIFKSNTAQYSTSGLPGLSSYSVYLSSPSVSFLEGSYADMCGQCRFDFRNVTNRASTDHDPKIVDNKTLIERPYHIEQENHLVLAMENHGGAHKTQPECKRRPEKLPTANSVAEVLDGKNLFEHTTGSQSTEIKAELCESPQKSRLVLGAVTNQDHTAIQSSSPHRALEGSESFPAKDSSRQTWAQKSVGTFPMPESESLNSKNHVGFLKAASQCSSVSVKYASNKDGVCTHAVESGLPSIRHQGWRSSGVFRTPVLYPQPPVIFSIPSLAFSKRVPTCTFKPVEPDWRGKGEEKCSSSAVRRVLEGVSRKLSKAQGPKTRQRTQKTMTVIDKCKSQAAEGKSREVRAKSRQKMDSVSTKKNENNTHTTSSSSSAKPTLSHSTTSRVAVKIVKPKRRSSLRLKTLAKILGRKRPNYSLVLSGYADMEEYEEEQKKKAAKSALAKAKAEARARASTKQQQAATIIASKPKEPEKMTTRSTSASVKDSDEKKAEDREKSSAMKRSLSTNSTGKESEERRASERERTGSLNVRRSLNSSFASVKDVEEKKVEGQRVGNTLKRSISSSSSGSSAGGKKETTPALSAIIETKRLKRDGGREGEEGKEKDAWRSGQGNAARDRKTVTSASPHPVKKVTPKKTPEKPVTTSTPEVGLSHLEKVPTFYPTEDEFFDPISYIDSICDRAEPLGMCRIIPPSSWKMESKVNDEIRFTTQIQHLHRLFNRWGPIVEQSRAIVHHLRDIINPQSSSTPQIGGVEVDLSKLYHMIRDLGGLQNIVDKKQWVKVADAMKIPKAAHDRVTRLYDVYCKFVLPFAMLTEAEREQTQKDAHMHYELSSAEEDAILKGKSITLGTFSRIARNVQSMWFKDQPSPEMVETAYWKIVEECKTHVAVQCAHVNTRAQSTAFPMRRESPYFRHSWNLNNLPDSKKCILKCLGPVSGATIPTLHVGMLFSTSCWSTDPHRLPYIQYLHTGASTIWYCIPKSHREKFHEAMRELCPTLIHNYPLWLSEDTAMVNPEALKAKGVHVVRCVQQPRQFVVVFPEVFTATVSCGYNVSESVHYATTQWLSVGLEAAKALWQSGEKELFSVDTLVCGLCQDCTDLDTLSAALPLLQTIVARELEERRQLSLAGLKCERRLAVEDSPGISASLARKRSHDLTEDSVCEVCYRICYLSMVLNEHDEQILCLEHGLRHVQRKRHIKAAKLFYRYTEEELTELVQATRERVSALSAGTPSNSSSTACPKKRTLKKQDSKS